MSSKDIHTRLGERNYPKWRLDTIALLMYKGCWRLVNGTWPQPADPAADDWEEWFEKRDQASGIIWASLEDSVKPLVQQNIENPIVMWAQLATLYAIESPASRFIAYDELFSITLQENETLTGLIARVENAVQHVKMLRGTGFNIQNLDDELSSMALIRALPFDSYGNFRSALLLMADVTYGTVKEAFMQEAKNRQPRATEQSMALRAAAPSSS